MSNHKRDNVLRKLQNYKKNSYSGSNHMTREQHDIYKYSFKLKN
ncbi:hypothetical protein CASFOL_005484 [Castilleja foliolosa]|uniref:Uncharacterized protein n=1 Tax=Castilleja foliolosa TaxID=1961234 RepID=A0ABD3E4N4_9LAMI